MQRFRFVANKMGTTDFFFNWISIIVFITEMRAKSVFLEMNDIATYMYEDLLDLNVAIARLKFALQTLFRSHA